MFDLLVLPRLYERLCEEKANEDDDGDEADSNNVVKRHRSLTSGNTKYLYLMKLPNPIPIIGLKIQDAFFQILTVIL